MEYAFCRIDTLGPIYVYRNDKKNSLKCLGDPYRFDDKFLHDEIIETFSHGKHNILIFYRYTVIEVEKLRKLLFKYLERK